SPASWKNSAIQCPWANTASRWMSSWGKTRAWWWPNSNWNMRMSLSKDRSGWDRRLLGRSSITIPTSVNSPINNGRSPLQGRKDHHPLARPHRRGSGHSGRSGRAPAGLFASQALGHFAFHAPLVLCFRGNGPFAVPLQNGHADRFGLLFVGGCVLDVPRVFCTWPGLFFGRPSALCFFLYWP